MSGVGKTEAVSVTAPPATMYESAPAPLTRPGAWHPTLEVGMHPESIPLGYCQCGCGGETSVAPKSDAGRGDVRGRPRRYVRGHGPHKGGPIIPLLERKTRLTPTGCWEWTGLRNAGGYGRVVYNGRWLAHRLTYALFVGPVPEGMVLDHLCRNPACINPEHLEPVTNAENLWRGKGTRLSWDDVTAIRAAFAAGTDRATLAEQYGMSRDYMNKIIGRRARATA